MSKKWHSGPPPSLGWWPASAYGNADRYRWWDGKRWSEWVESLDHIRTVAAMARAPADKYDLRNGIKWQHRPANWPARSKT